MFDGNTFLPVTGTPMRKMACMMRPFAEADPVPLAVAILKAKSLIRSIELKLPAASCQLPAMGFDLKSCQLPATSSDIRAPGPQVVSGLEAGCWKLNSKLPATSYQLPALKFGR